MNDQYRTPFWYRFSRPVLRMVFRLIFRILGRVKVIGRENVPRRQPYLVAINHISLFDPPLAAAFLPEAVEIVGASDVFDRPGQGQLLKLYGVIPAHRGEYDRNLLRRAVAVLKAGYALLIAPEGGRSHVTAMRRAFPGIAYLAEETGVPVIPVALVGTTDDFWQRAKRLERPLLEIRIGQAVQLPPITGTGAERRIARQENADLVMRHVAGLLPEEYRGVYSASAILPMRTGQ